MSSKQRLKVVAAAWGGVAVATVLYRALKRKANAMREGKVAAQGGLVSARTVVEALEGRGTRDETRDGIALVGADGAEYSWNAYSEASAGFGRACVATGGSRGGVAVHAFNEPRWFFSALGALSVGWTISGIYTTNTYEQSAHVLRTSGVKVLVLEGAAMLETTYATVLEDFPAVTVVLLEGGGAKTRFCSERTPTWESFVSRGGYRTRASTAAFEEARARASKAETVASLVYTSGTTGNPKAVELTNGNVTSVCAMMHARIPLDESTVLVSYLPLSHIAAMGIDVFSAVVCGAKVCFADADALKGSLKKTLLEARPTLFFGVPRVWEKMAAAMHKAAAESYAKPLSGPPKKAVASAAKAVAAAWWSPTTPEALRGALALPMAFFKAVAFRKIRRACGLDRCGLLYTGAAPLPAETQLYLRSVDMPLLEVFGMSESCGAIAVCGPFDGDRPVGACGRPLPLGDLEIAPDGEVLWRGPNVMRGYKGLPDATAAAKSTATNQLHTGDRGVLDTRGFLHVTGRKKDLIITAGGENVAPTPIEDVLLKLIGATAGHVVLVGDKRKYLTILVAPADDAPEPPTESAVENAIREFNASYAKSRAQTLQKARVLQQPFSVDTDELTPTLKLKRAFVVAKFNDDIDALYTGDVAGLVSYSTSELFALESRGP